VSDLVFVSPHLDDAVLSCGGRIARAVAAGRRVVVATLFTRDEPAEPPSRLAADLRRWWKLPAGEVMAIRRAEDREACARLGAEPLHLDLPEAPYRLDSAGRPLYTTLAALFDRLDGDDRPWVDAIAARLAELGAGAELVGPLGVGNHVDHQLARRALERARPDAALYEEFPYSEWKWFAVARALGRKRDWADDVLPLAPAEVEARLRAIAAYASQVPSLFRTEGRLRRQLRRALARAGGERLWRRRAGA
jgi:LmbE family N-acetylglucosaminyl deacetylase